MNVVKNKCERIFGTLSNIKGNSKDGKKSHEELQKMGLRKSLWPEVKGQKNFPSTCTAYSFKERETNPMSCYFHVKGSRWLQL